MPRYNDYFVHQLTELLTGYGDIADVWFDGACGEGPNGKRQVYDWARYWSVIRELQPGATISVMGPDVRWCGNEAGASRASEWSVMPLSASETDGTEAWVGAVTSFNAQAAAPGSAAALREGLASGDSLTWWPVQVNTSIRPGWFYHEEVDERVKSLDHLLDIYYGSVGGNAQFLLNLPPDRRGRIHENDVERLRDLGRVLRGTFDEDLAFGAATNAPETVDGRRGTFWQRRTGPSPRCSSTTLGSRRRSTLRYSLSH
ncbi:MAG: alpha-L-fucosidase [Planctomycetota bacterium]